MGWTEPRQSGQVKSGRDDPAGWRSRPSMNESRVTGSRARRSSVTVGAVMWSAAPAAWPSQLRSGRLWFIWGRRCGMHGRLPAARWRRQPVRPTSEVDLGLLCPGLHRGLNEPPRGSRSRRPRPEGAYARTRPTPPAFKPCSSPNAKAGRRIGRTSPGLVFVTMRSQRLPPHRVDAVHTHHISAHQVPIGRGVNAVASVCANGSLGLHTRNVLLLDEGIPLSGRAHCCARPLRTGRVRSAHPAQANPGGS